MVWKAYLDMDGKERTVAVKCLRVSRYFGRLIQDKSLKNFIRLGCNNVDIEILTIYFYCLERIV